MLRNRAGRSRRHGRSRWLGVLRRHQALFAHWPASPNALAALTPRELALDRFEGRPWLTLCACLVTQLSLWGRPRSLAPRSMVMVSLATYVSESERPGLLWISLDTSRSRMALVARHDFGWPAHAASFSLEPNSGRLLVEGRREGADDASFRAWYRGEPERAREPTSPLERFLFDRGAAYGRRPSGSVTRTELSGHGPWQLAPAQAELSCSALLDAAGLPAPDAPPLLHFVSRQDTLVSRPSPMDRTTRSGRDPRARCRTT